MSSILLTLPEIYNAYKNWVRKNPQSLGDWETSAKWISYFIAGRINNSHVVSELVYCLSNLLVMFNDIIIKKNYCQMHSTNSAEKLKLWLTIIEYSEVFCELSAKKLWGVTGKWIIIVCIQVFKCITRLMLIYRYKETVIQHPPIPVLDRKNIKSATNLSTIGEMAQNQFDTSSFILKSSGRVVRKIEASPPLALRTWKPVPKSQNVSCKNNELIEDVLSGRKLIAETIYVTKPMIHLASQACFGTKTWKPWLIALTMDLASLHLYRSCRAIPLNSLTPQQRLQLSKRQLLLVLYIIRSPFYEKQSRDKINALLEALSKHVPLAGLICKPLAQYLPFWQSTYFYMWST
ncbi:peroxisomal membrane protein PEX16 [Anoplophora glabripennis]|uniref:peroxisomal membrane protein PEX16 n=1 Tax=Anoplophora glabripennis TaxID=217634 RepID=UPI0008736E86|nr:peroxisomal membrane protein PEX16 [Anoplophora glabripennis]